jgi:hypothetical protein
MPRGIFPRKGAKAQSAAAFLKALLCAFASLRGKIFSSSALIRLGDDHEQKSKGLRSRCRNLKL